MKKKLLILIISIAILFTIALSADTPPKKSLEAKILQLKKQLETARGKDKVEILNSLVQARRSPSSREALEYGRQALELATQIGDDEGKSKALMRISFAQHLQGEKQAAWENAERAYVIAQKLGKPSIISETLKNKGAICRIDGKFDEGEKYLLRALELLEGDENNYYTRVESLSNLGAIYRLKKEYEKSMKCCREMLGMARKKNNKLYESWALEGIARVNIDLANYREALKVQLQALQIQEEIGDKKGIEISQLNIGVVYGNLEDYDKALPYFQEALKISKELGDRRSRAVNMGFIAKVYLEKGKYREALEYCETALVIHRELKRNRSISLEIIRIGDIHQKQGNFRPAIKYYREALTIQQEIGDITQTGRSLKKIGNAYLDLKDYKKASENLSKAAKILKKVKENNLLQDTYKLLSRLFEETGQYKKALQYHKLYAETKDTIYNRQSSRQIAEAQTRYDTLKKEQKIELLEKEGEIKRLDLIRQKTARNFFIAGFVLMSLILGLIFKRYLYLFAFWKKEKYVGQYRLQEEIGVGGMGTVYRAHNIKDKKQTVAVKVLKPELFKDEDHRTRFKQEATIIDKLDHPNIIKIYERGEYKDKMYIAMELLNGKTLDEIIKEKEHQRMEIAESLTIMHQTADALAAIHDKNIIHRDLKPSNIMLIQKDGNPHHVKLLDFGLARMKHQTRITRTGMLLGTINYMSPEQLTESEYTPASDVYSLGVTYYEMLTGNIAFPGEYPNEVMKQILDTDPVEPARCRPEIPAEISRLIQAMMAKNKTERPNIMDVYKTLQQWTRQTGTVILH